VSCNKRAWHAGVSELATTVFGATYFSPSVSSWKAVTATRLRDIQYEKLAELTRAIQEAYPIKEIVGHSDMRSGAQDRSGPCFDWQKYRNLIAAAGSD